LSFFDDLGDWTYVFNYKSYGVLSAEGFSQLMGWKRVVIRTIRNTTYSVVRLEFTPPMEWEAVRITDDGEELIGDPEHYTIEELFELFRDA
jgi:hypothetical protein